MKKPKYEILEEIVRFLYPEFFTDVVEEDYLSRDDRILSLAKVKYGDYLSRLKIGELERKIFEKKIINLWDFQKESKNVVRNYLQKEEYGILFIKQEIESIAQRFGITVEISEVESSLVSTGIRRKFLKYGGRLLKCLIYENGRLISSFFSSTKRCGRQLYFESGDFWADIADSLSSLMTYCYCIGTILDGKCDEKMNKLKIENMKTKHGVYAFNQEHFKYLCSLQDSNYYESEHGTNVSFEFIPFLKDSGLNLHYEDLLKCKSTKGRIVFTWPSMVDYFSSYKYLEIPFQVVLEDKKKIIKAVNHITSLEKSSSDRAKAYMLKKNIPEKTLKRMESSILNSYFGFVEYDEDVDLEKVLEIEKEFEAFHSKYIPTISSKDDAIRFRKLGNYKASGLYFPFIGCLCVDLRSPASFIHEYGHLMDYRLGCDESLSLKEDFSEITKMYEERLRDNMRKNEEFGRNMKGTSKYSLDYYLTPTEIFARAFELFTSKCLKVKNSLLPEVFDKNVYPQDEQYIEKIGNYFSKLLCIELTKEL